MSKNPKEAITKIEKILQGWETIASDRTFGGITLEEFKKLVLSSREMRELVNNLNTELLEATSKRNDADKKALATAQLVVNGVIGDPNFGPDSSLYESMGYIRKSERKKGLTRKRSSDTNK
ncbi:MAG: hypothetical protein JNN15_17080 [Blastocatellia bacterium]|nr:hypothetical protein [Blastocatellia bacterium]